MATESLSVHPRGFLTPEDARSFDGYSVANAIAVKTALAERGCACEPYEDVFTFNRWRAQGRLVRADSGARPDAVVPPRRGRDLVVRPGRHGAWARDRPRRHAGAGVLALNRTAIAPHLARRVAPAPVRRDAGPAAPLRRL